VSARLVACESLLLLCREICGLREAVISALLPAAAAEACQAFFTQIDDVLPEVKQWFLLFFSFHRSSICMCSNAISEIKQKFKVI
jgi:hypothetical protein